MNQTLQSLLRLQELELLCQGLELAGVYVEEAGSIFLKRKLTGVRREIPGTVLSQYDSLRRSYAEALAPALRNRCQGCHEPISRRLVLQLEHSNQMHRCLNCGRFLYPHERAPDYVTTK